MRTPRQRRSALLATVIAGALGLASCTTAGQPDGLGTTAIGAGPASTAITKPAASADPNPVSSSLDGTATVTANAPAASDAAAATSTPGSAPTETSPPRTTPPRTTPPGTPAPTAALGSVGVVGVNDPSCTSDHRPVVLLHGTFSTVKSNFAAMATALQGSGRCVYGIDYGVGGLRPVRESAAAVTAFIDDVLSATGAEQVDVVAFSQGGLVLRTALREDGVAGKVAVAVLIAPSFHGTTSTLLSALPAGACPACGDQAANSPLLSELDAGGDLDGAVRYAVVSSLDDTIVTPVPSQVPRGPADRVRSIVVQDQCPGEKVDHIAMPADPGVIGWTVDALDTDGSPDPAALSCR